jgi:hypothetical protein
MGGFAARALVVLLSALVLAWLAVGLRAVRLEDQAQAVLDRARSGEVSNAEVEQARDRLHEAADLSPDRGPAIREGQLLDAVGRRAEADFIAQLVVLDEPENLQARFLAWVTAADPEARQRALDELRKLNPFIDVALGLRECLRCPLKKR